MTLFELHLELKELTAAVREIAVILDRAFPERKVMGEAKPARVVHKNDKYFYDLERERLRKEGKLP